MDSGVRVLLDEATAIIADRLGRQDTLESEMLAALDGVPASVVLAAADRLGVTVRGLACGGLGGGPEATGGAGEYFRGGAI
jgi:hypothetical protein